MAAGKSPNCQTGVIYRGEFVAILDAHTATIEEIGLLMAGGQIDKK
jgi:ABC-type uncharacterized transport system ATPase subunit